MIEFTFLYDFMCHPINYKMRFNEVHPFELALLGFEVEVTTSQEFLDDQKIATSPTSKTISTKKYNLVQFMASDVVDFLWNMSNATYAAGEIYGHARDVAVEILKSMESKEEITSYIIHSIEKRIFLLPEGKGNSNFKFHQNIVTIINRNYITSGKTLMINPELRSGRQ